MARKFEEMDEMIQSLPSRPASQMVAFPLMSQQDVELMFLSAKALVLFQEKERINGILREYQRKKAVSIIKSSIFSLLRLNKINSHPRSKFNLWLKFTTDLKVL